MDDPRLVALGLVPPPPGQEKAEETPDATASPPLTPEWQPAQQSQYMPPPNPFSAAPSTIPEYPDPFTSPPPAAAPRPAPPPAQPAVPSIFNSPNSPFSFAPSSSAPASSESPTTAPSWTSAAARNAPTAAPSPFTSPNSPFSVASAPIPFTPAAPTVAPTTKQDKKAALRAIEEAKKAAKLAEENAVKAAKVAEEDAKRNAKLAAAQAKIDEAEAKIAEREAKNAEREAQKEAKRGKPAQT